MSVKSREYACSHSGKEKTGAMPASLQVREWCLDSSEPATMRVHYNGQWMLASPATRSEDGNLFARWHVDSFMRILALFSLFFAASMCTHSDVQPEPEIQQGERRGTVTVYRDDWGVPHVYASREEDGFYGLGYAQAEDRLEGILRRYLEVR